MAAKQSARDIMETRDITLAVLKANQEAMPDITSKLALCHRLGLFRFFTVEDEYERFENLCGDCYNPEANPDIDSTLLAKQKRAYRSRVSREGVWGILLEVRENSRDEWDVPGGSNLESLWGNVGTEFIGSGYDADFLRTADEYFTQYPPSNTDSQAALLSAARAATILISAIYTEYPDMVLPGMEASDEPIQTLKRLGDALTQYQVDLNAPA